ncbi:N-acetylmuramoyl-L-alanine amidase, partial [Romboutsia ilealis]|nr:N-acetylmuramoyl-L-alanine amidase [Romboutsia ilealis]
MSKYLVLGDGGHAEEVAGKCAPDKSLHEWKFNQEVDTKMEKRCKDHGIDYYQTNPNPKGKDEMGLSKRAELANAHWKKLGKPKALLMSYHANAYYEKDKNGKTKVEFNSARGTETFIASNASTNSKNAAKYIQDEIVKTMKSLDKNAKDRGVKTENWTVIYKAQMPSILLEYGFYTNKADIKILKTNVDDLVEATMKGVCKYFGITYKAPK